MFKIKSWPECSISLKAKASSKMDCIELAEKEIYKKYPKKDYETDFNFEDNTIYLDVYSKKENRQEDVIESFIFSVKEI